MNGSCTQSGMKPARNAQEHEVQAFSEGAWKNLAYYGRPVLFGRLSRPPILGRGVRKSAQRQADKALDNRFLVNNHGMKLALISDSSVPASVDIEQSSSLQLAAFSTRRSCRRPSTVSSRAALSQNLAWALLALAAGQPTGCSKILLVSSQSARLGHGNKQPLATSPTANLNQFETTAVVCSL